MGKLTEEFQSYRQRMNDKILSSGNKVMKRIYSVDTLTYQDGALSVKNKEMLGLVASILKNAVNREFPLMRFLKYLQ